jgi:hypothetical protein
MEAVDRDRVVEAVVDVAQHPIAVAETQVHLGGDGRCAVGKQHLGAGA